MNYIIKSNIISSGEEEKEQPTVDRLLYSSSSYHQHGQQQHFLPPAPPVHHHGGGWLLDCHSHQEGQPSSNHEQQDLGSSMMVEREHMFDKVVTPSDVGKLNRLVIPKKHAERYFPLDSSNNDKGLLLNFEDRFGKIWRFRYAYWNSSQSYVMTKGWSRFVKEKKLDAGDIVSFQRGVGVTAKDRLFIDWKRHVNASSLSQPYHFFPNHNFVHPWNNPLVLQSLPARRNPNLNMLHPPNNLYRDRSRSIYFGSGGLGITPPQQVHTMQRNGFGLLGFDPRVPAHAPTSSNTPDHEKSYGKRLRLFGVNMDCAVSDDEDDQDYYHPTELPQTSVVGYSSINPISSSLVSLSTIPYLQLRPSESITECNQSIMKLSSSSSSSSSSAHDFNLTAKSTLPSNMSLDLEI